MKHLIWIGAMLSCSACEQPQEPTRTAKPTISAEGIRIELALDKGQLVARGDKLSYGDAGSAMRVEGDASITFENGAFLRASAETITVIPDRLEVQLEGSVRTRFEVLEEEVTDAAP